MSFKYTTGLLTPFFAALTLSPALAQDLGATSLNKQITVVPALSPVQIDGKTNDWDLSAGIWSYNNPTLVNKYSVWTHLMWDEKGIYWLARYHDTSPLQNSTRGKDFGKSWQADAYQVRSVFDEKTPDEHQMHINIFYSTPEKTPYMIVKHGGFRAAAPFDATGPDRPDLLEKFGNTMDAAGGKIAFSPWDDGKGYNAEAFWPWKYLRQNGQPMKPGEEFVFGFDALWSNADGTEQAHRLVDNMRDDKVNRIFFFRDRKGWGKAVISNKGKLDITQAQTNLQEQRLKLFVDFDTYGSIPIKYDLPEDRDVTIAIDNQSGERVRTLFGQYPRKKGPNSDLWDGLDDDGKPVPAGKYSATIVDHKPVQVKLINSLYNAATPPWVTEGRRKIWGANHGHPTSISTRGDVTLVSFTGVEGTTGSLRVSADGIIQWSDVNEQLDVTLDDKFAYGLGRDSTGADLRRFNIENGELTPFADAKRSPKITLPFDTKTMPNSSSLALWNGKLWAFVPGQKLLRIAPNTGEIEATLETGDLLAITERNDVLYGLLTGGRIAVLDENGRALRTVFTAANLKKPMRLAVSHDAKRFAVSDFETNQVFVFDGTGKLLQTLGKPFEAVNEMRPAGKFVENDLIRPLGLDFDSQNRLWVTEAADTNRRVTMWTPQGQLAKQFWGGADYGGMSGFAVTHDSTRFIAHGVEFKLDPNPDFRTRPTAETPLFFHPALARHQRGFIYKVGNHEYAVNTPGFNKQDSFSISVRDQNGIFVPRVRVEYALTRPVARAGTAWTDKNANGIVDAGETVGGVRGRNVYWSVGWIRPDLTIITPDQLIYKPQGFTADGVPLYDFANPIKPANTFIASNTLGSKGSIVMDKEGNLSDGIYYATLDGRTGKYPNYYGLHDAPAAQRGLLIAPFRTNGVIENVPGVGSITALGGDRGEWFLMSMDGLYLSSILQDSKGEVDLNETFIGQESFGGFMWRDEKGRILAQLGGISYRIVEITGLETTRKNTQTVEISAAQIAEGERIAASRRKIGIQEPETLKIARVAALPKVAIAPDSKDELIAGTLSFTIQEVGDPTRRFRAALVHDGTNLSVMWQVNDINPWKNGEGRFTHAFIGGDSVDLKLDIPERGPIRVLAAPIGGENTVVYWQKKAPQQENSTTYMVGNNTGNAQRFDVVKRLESAKLNVQTNESGYSVLLTVPLADLGIDPTKPTSFKGLIGAIFSDPAGKNRASRLYWHDKATGLVSDVPTESSVNPSTWGKIELSP